MQLSSAVDLALGRRKAQIKAIVRRRYVLRTLSVACRSRLGILAALHGTDKLAHGYIPRYEMLFRKNRNRKFSMLEIGIGGYEGYTTGGESLRMWKAYFPNAQIHGLDILDKSHVKEKRITVWQGSQTDAGLLQSIHKAAGGFDVVIDDGSHRNDHVIRSFEILFPLLNPGGMYVIEDVQTSYWPQYGGKLAIHDEGPHTTMGYFKRRADRLNHQEFRGGDFVPEPLDTEIDGVFFWHNLIALSKAAKREGPQREFVQS